LKADINYFIKNFKDNLRTEILQYNRIDKNKITDLRKIHRAMVGKLNPRAKGGAGRGGRVGIVINPDEYLKEKFNDFLAERTMQGLRPQDLVLDVDRQADEDREVRDYGSFEVRSARHGRLAIEKEPIYNAIPKTTPEEVQRQSVGYRRQRVKLPTLKTRYYSKVDTSKRELKNNPFISIPKTQRKLNRINFLY